MRILRDEAAIAALPDDVLRRLIMKRVDEINECCPWDSDELGCFVAVEPGDTAEDLEAEIGFSVMRGLFDDMPFGNEDFSPGFEWAEAHPEGFYELVYIISDGGFGYDIFIANQPGVDPGLLAMCQAYAKPST